jgi:hypothetical protein
VKYQSDDPEHLAQIRAWAAGRLKELAQIKARPTDEIGELDEALTAVVRLVGEVERLRGVLQAFLGIEWEGE